MRPQTISPSSSREQTLRTFRGIINNGHVIIGGGAGVGLSAKAQSSGGIDFLVVYNSGRFRMAGLGSLAGLMPYGDANATTVELGREVLHAVDGQTPVIAGVCATDPFRDMGRFLTELKAQGFVGIQNFPTVGLIDGVFRQNLEETGMGYGNEVDMIKRAHDLDLITTPYVFSAEDARQMTKAGADIIVAHMGLTTSGKIGARTAPSLETCVQRIQDIVNAARVVNPDIIVLCHGGPIATVDDARYILSECSGVQGFLGASSMERLPVEVAIQRVTEEYKGMRLK